MNFEVRERKVGPYLVSYFDEGEGDPIVFVHGWGASKRFWQFQVDSFRNTHRCIALDLPGHGDSSRSRAPLTLDVFLHVFQSFVDDLHLKSFVLAGHSMGGMIAMKFALRHPGRVKQLLACNTLGKGDALQTSSRLVATRLGYFLFRSVFLLIPPLRPRISKTWGLLLRTDPRLAADSLKGNYWNRMTSVVSIRKADFMEELKSLHVPTLVIGSDLDELIDREHARALHSHLPDSEFHLFTDTGHCAMLQRYKEFNRLMGAFLK